MATFRTIHFWNMCWRNRNEITFFPLSEFWGEIKINHITTWDDELLINDVTRIFVNNNRNVFCTHKPIQFTSKSSICLLQMLKTKSFMFILMRKPIKYLLVKIGGHIQIINMCYKIFNSRISCSGILIRICCQIEINK